MIIRYPTGLFSTVLPQSASDPTSVVFTISGDLPESRTQNFPILPDGIRKNTKPPKTYTSVDRRNAVGNLIYVNSTYIESEIKSGQPLYKLGQILEFVATTSPQDNIIPNFSGKTTTTRHDIAKLDTTLIGVPELFNTPAGSDETIKSMAVQTYNETLAQIEELQVQYDSFETHIDLHFKTINESNRAIIGLNAIIASNPVQSIIDVRDELVASVNTEQAALDSDVSDINQIPTQIAALKDILNSLVIFVE